MEGGIDKNRIIVPAEEFKERRLAIEKAKEANAESDAPSIGEVLREMVDSETARQIRALNVYDRQEMQKHRADLKTKTSEDLIKIFDRLSEKSMDDLIRNAAYCKAFTLEIEFRTGEIDKK